jgi:Tol biopolymer transport system component/DNA-binding winged helix-turn-helix (wHTH) protein
LGRGSIADRKGKIVFMPLASNSFCFEPFSLDVRAAELHSNGTKIKLGEQPFQVLCALLEHPGEVVTREELRKRLWSADTFVDFDHSLNAAVKRLREMLGDSADAPRFIETLPRHGYRFIAPVEKPTSGASSDTYWKRLPERLTSSKRAWVLGATLLVLLSCIGFWLFSRKPQSSQSLVEVVPLAGLRGYEAEPAVSPDGNQVAFVAGEGHDRGTYTALVGGEKPLRLTSNSNDHYPAWSPDGRQIAFYRYSDEGLAIYTIPAQGGTEHLVYKGPANTWHEGGVDWSPDGETLVFSENNEDKIHSRIALLSLADFRVRPLTSPPDQYQDCFPVFSPDGSMLAFQRENVAGTTAEIFIVPVAGGNPKQLTFEHANKFGAPAWTKDGREIVFSSWSQGGLTSLWRIAVSGGKPTSIAGVGLGAFNPSIPRRSNLLAYQDVVSKDYIWRLDLKDEKHRRGPPNLLVSEKGRKMRPHFSPDGERITFESDRLGSWEIWTCNAGDGSNCAQLTSLHRVAGGANWSPDGRFVAFEFHPEEQSEIYVVEVANGQARLVPTMSGSDNLAPSWSRDGQWLYFASRRGAGRSRFQIWKLPVKGGSPVQVTKNGGIYGLESSDGRFLYFLKYDVPGIWKMPINGGEESLVLDRSHRILFRDWAVAKKGIYFISFETHPEGTIEFFEFSTRKIIPIWDLEKPANWGLALSPDAGSLLYVQREFSESNIMLVKNFH